MRGGGLIKDFVRAVKSVKAGHKMSNVVLEKVGDPCPHTIVHDFFMLLLIPPTLSPMRFHMIHIGCDRFLRQLKVSQHQHNHRHTTLMLRCIDIGYLQ